MILIRRWGSPLFGGCGKRMNPSDNIYMTVLKCKSFFRRNENMGAFSGHDQMATAKACQPLLSTEISTKHRMMKFSRFQDKSSSVGSGGAGDWVCPRRTFPVDTGGISRISGSRYSSFPAFGRFPMNLSEMVFITLFPFVFMRAVSRGSGRRKILIGPVRAGNCLRRNSRAPHPSPFSAIRGRPSVRLRTRGTRRRGDS